MVSVSASVNLPLHHKVQKFSSCTGSPRWSRKKGHKTVVCVCVHAPCSPLWANIPQIRKYIISALSSADDWAMATGNMYRKFHEVWTCFFRYASRQTDRHTNMHITILCPRLHPYWQQSNKYHNMHRATICITEKSCTSNDEKFSFTCHEKQSITINDVPLVQF